MEESSEVNKRIENQAIDFLKATDDELLLALASGTSKEIIFVVLLKRYQKIIYKHNRHLVVSHDDADDATQNTFIKIWHNLDKFRGESQLRTWIYRIATNECINLLRRKKSTIDFDEAQPDMADYLTEDIYLSPEDISLKLQRAMCFLPYKQKLVFTLRYFEDLSYEEISKLTETSEGALKASYHHAVKKLEIYLNVLR